MESRAGDLPCYSSVCLSATATIGQGDAGGRRGGGRGGRPGGGGGGAVVTNIIRDLNIST